MSLTKDSSVLWSDIQAIYSELNTAKSRLSQTAVTVPSKPTTVKTDVVSNLKNAIESCDANKYISAARAAVTGVTVPSAGTLLYPDIFTRMRTTISKIQSTCLHDSAHYTSNHGFSSFSMNMFNSRANSSNSGFSYHNSF